MSTKSAEGDSRENSPERDGSPGKRPSKKRKVLSCYACRSRKMKCDRVYPVCGRCQKTGRGDQCTYDPRLLEDLAGASNVNVEATHTGAGLSESGTQGNATESASLHALQWKIKIQERRIQELERKLAEKESDQHSGSRYRAIPLRDVDGKEQMLFRGKGFKTSFHGATSWMSSIGQFREMVAFTHQALKTENSIFRIGSDFRAFRDRRKCHKKHQGLKIFGTHEEIFAAVPERHILDPQVAFYFQTCETTYRILHEPSFWKEYHSFWERKSDDNSNAGFATILVLIYAITKCLGPKDDFFDGDITVDRQAASDLLDICDAWVHRQPPKRLTLQFFQTQCLATVAKRINCVMFKQDWFNSGQLVRLAITSGMHRDTALLSRGEMSPFEEEMRKRLWATIMELELQASIDTGRPSSLASLYWDTPSPANLPDDAFSIDTKELPAGRPPEHFTSASYVRLTLQSLPLRNHLTQILNDPSEVMQYEDVLHYDGQIHEMLSKLPSWTSPQAAVPLALLQMQLRQFLLILHKPYAKAASENSRYIHSFAQYVDAGSTNAIMQNDLIEKGIFILNHVRSDAVRLSLGLAEIAHSNCIKQSPVDASTLSKSPSPDCVVGETHIADVRTKFWFVSRGSASLTELPRQPLLVRYLCISALETLHLTLGVFERKVMRLGTGYMEYWLLCAASGMLPPLPGSKPPATSLAHIMAPEDDIQTRCRKSLDRFQALAYKILTLQKDPNNTWAATLRTSISSVSPSDVRTPSVGPAAGAGYGGTPIIGNDGTYSATSGMGMGTGVDPNDKDISGPFGDLQDMQIDMSGWTFPDLWAFDLGGEF